VAEAPGDGTQVDTGGEQFGGRVVPKLAEFGLDFEPAEQAGVAVRERARVPGLTPVWRLRERELRSGQRQAQADQLFGAVALVLAYEGAAGTAGAWWPKV